MPKVTSNLKNELAESRKEGWNNGNLFGTESTESIPGIGFKDETKAKETIKILEDRDITYQYHVINTMYNRAKIILKRTRDQEKITNLTEAIDIFENWIKDYKGHSRHKENFGYLPLDVVETYEKLAKYYKIPNDRFLNAYKEVDGDYKKLRNKVISKSNITWDVCRNREIRPLITEINEKKKAMYETEGLLSGLPSKAHTEVIMWAYSPDSNKIKKCVTLLDKI